MSRESGQVCPNIREDGITELSVPKNGEIIADVIFVHGLKGHPRRTWEYGKTRDVSDDHDPKTKLKLFSFRKTKGKTKDSANNESCYWPFDLLPNDCGNARILTYGYDSHPTHFYKSPTNQMTISQHGRDLLAKIANNRRNCMTRPLIFVAHSLGGILVKDALVESNKHNQQPHMQAIAKQCHAIFFFGTPHQGSAFADWGRLLGNIVGTLPGGPSVYDGVLRGLSPDSEKLESLTRDFNDMLNANIPIEQKLKLFSFQEGKGIGKAAGLDSKVVPDTSSAFGRRDLEISIFVDENHMNICRFKNRSHLAYEDFRASLSNLLQNLSKEIPAEDVSEKEYMRMRSNKWDEVRTDILERLDFEGRRVRENQLGNLQTHSETLDWIWKSSFADWVRRTDSKSENIFWIHGKPASGKSTLMHHISKSATLPEMLSGSTQQIWDVVYHFFDFRAGKGIGNNFEGFLRSLLYQMLKDGYEIEDLRERGTIDVWSIGYLRETVLSKLKLSSRSIFLMLDGLDEYEGRPLELIQFIHQLARHDIRVCLASRPEPAFEAAFEEMPKLKMQACNYAGIESFVTLTLKESLSSSSFSDDSDLVSLSRKIGQRADGMFLWARFATYELAEGFAQGDDLHALEQRLEQIPQELEDIYARIFNKLESSKRREAGYMLQLVCSAYRTLYVEELMAAMEHVRANSGFRLSKVSKHICRQFERKIMRITGGALEILEFLEEDEETYSYAKRTDAKRVSITHKTVYTYLETKGWQQLLPEPQDHQLTSKALWLHICTGQFASEVQASPFLPSGIPPGVKECLCNPDEIDFEKSISYSARMSSVPDKVMNRAPLREYAADFMLLYAAEFEEACQIPALPLIEKSLKCSFFRFHWFFSTNIVSRCQCFMLDVFPRGPLHIAIGHGMARSVSVYLANVNLLGEIDSNEHKLPFWLSEMSCSESFTPIIAEGIDFSEHTALLQASFDFFENLPAGSEEICLLEYAIRALPEESSSTTRAVLSAILQYNPQVNDDTMIVALATRKPEVARWLLSTTATGKDRFVPDQDPRTFQLSKPHIRELLLTPTEADLLSRLRIANPAFGPLWISLRHRQWPNFIIFRNELGQAINDQCSPFGTALHSAINTFPPKQVIDFLVEVGGDIHAQVLFGTPLEYAWLLLHIETDDDQASILADAVKALIAKGAVNNREDPNGCIPPQDWMLLVSTLCDRTLNSKLVEVFADMRNRCKDIYAGSVPYPTTLPPLPNLHKFRSIDFSDVQAWLLEFNDLIPGSTMRWTREEIEDMKDLEEEDW